MSFYLKNNFLDDNQSDLSLLADEFSFIFGMDTVYLADVELIISLDPIGQIEVNNYVYNDLTNFTFDINDEIMDRLNIDIDRMSINGDNKDPIILYIAPSGGLDSAQFDFYPHINPFIFDFEKQYRSINSDSTFIDIVSELDFSVIGYPSVKISSPHTLLDTMIYATGSVMEIIDGKKIRLNLDQMVNNEPDGLFSIAVVINNDTDTTSIPFARYYLQDRTAPVFELFSPLPGKNSWNGKGQDISLKDTLKVYLTDGPVFFDSEGATHTKYDKLPIDLSYAFDNQDSIAFAITLNEENIVSKLDKFIINEEFSSLYTIDNESQLSALAKQSGDMSYAFTIKDKAGNSNNIDILFYLVLNQNTANAHFFNYPNPFSPRNGETTNFRYTLLENTSWGKLLVFDNNGDLVYLYKLQDNELFTGTYTIPWDGDSIYGSKLANGVYFSIIQFPKGKTRTIKTAVVN